MKIHGASSLGALNAHMQQQYDEPWCHCNGKNSYATRKRGKSDRLGVNGGWYCLWLVVIKSVLEEGWCMHSCCCSSGTQEFRLCRFLVQYPSFRLALLPQYHSSAVTLRVCHHQRYMRCTVVYTPCDGELHSKMDFYTCFTTTTSALVEKKCFPPCLTFN